MSARRAARLAGPGALKGGDVPVLDWLLEPDSPSVRYYTLRDLGGRRARPAEVRAAQAAIMNRGSVPLILAKQRPAGSWGRAEDFYERSKYWGTVWTFILLAELGADGRDGRVRKACEFLLRWSQDRASGGFAYRGSASGGGQHSGVIPCLTGNIVWSLIRFGYLDDPRVQNGVDWIVRHTRFDDGDGPAPKGWPYQREPCYGRHTCFFGIAKPLKALAEIPARRRFAAVRRTIGQSVEFLLRHRLYRKSHDPACIAKPIWAKFGFPLMWQTDALEMFDILTGLGVRDERMGDAAELIRSKRTEQGWWRLERTTPGRMIVNLEKVGRPSKWVTLFALRSLRRYSLLSRKRAVSRGDS